MSNFDRVIITSNDKPIAFLDFTENNAENNEETKISLTFNTGTGKFTIEEIDGEAVNVKL